MNITQSPHPTDPAYTDKSDRKSTKINDTILPIAPSSPSRRARSIDVVYRRIGHTEPFTWRAVTQKLETQNKKEDQISTPHPPR